MLFNDRINPFHSFFFGFEGAFLNGCIGLFLMFLSLCACNESSKVYKCHSLTACGRKLLVAVLGAGDIEEIIPYLQ